MSLSRLDYCILNQADKHGNTLIQAYVSTPLSVEADYLLQQWLVLE